MNVLLITCLRNSCCLCFFRALRGAGCGIWCLILLSFVRTSGYQGPKKRWKVYMCKLRMRVSIGTLHYLEGGWCPWFVTYVYLVSRSARLLLNDRWDGSIIEMYIVRHRSPELKSVKFIYDVQVTQYFYLLPVHHIPCDSF